MTTRRKAATSGDARLTASSLARVAAQMIADAVAQGDATGALGDSLEAHYQIREHRCRLVVWTSRDIQHTDLQAIRQAFGAPYSPVWTWEEKSGRGGYVLRWQHPAPSEVEADARTLSAVRMLIAATDYSGAREMVGQVFGRLEQVEILDEIIRAEEAGKG